MNLDQYREVVAAAGAFGLALNIFVAAQWILLGRKMAKGPARKAVVVRAWYPVIAAMVLGLVVFFRLHYAISNSQMIPQDFTALIPTVGFILAGWRNMLAIPDVEILVRMKRQ